MTDIKIMKCASSDGFRCRYYDDDFCTCTKPTKACRWIREELVAMTVKCDMCRKPVKEGDGIWVNEMFYCLPCKLVFKRIIEEILDTAELVKNEFAYNLVMNKDEHCALDSILYKLYDRLVEVSQDYDIPIPDFETFRD